MGFAAGFQVGASAVERGLKMREEDKLKRELAQAYAAPTSDIGYTPADMAEMRRQQETGAYDIQGIPGAEGQPPTLRYTPRQGLELGQGEMPAAPTDFAPQQVQRYGGQTVAGQFDPMQLQGLQMREAARVIGASGDPVRAAQMLAEATRLDRDAEDRAYQARIRPIQEEQMRQQGILTGGQISAMKKTQERDTKLEGVDADVAQWQSSRLLDPNTNEPRQPTMDDNIAALQYRATALQKAGLAKEATESLRDYQGFAVNQIKLDETQRNSQLGAVAAAIAAGDLTPAVAFYDRYVLDGAKVTGMRTDPKTGAITVTRVRDDGQPMPDKVVKGGANELLAALNSFKDPMALYNYSQNEFKNNLQLKDLGIKEKSLAIQTAAAVDAKLSPIEKNVAGLKRLGVNVTPAMIESLGGLDKADSPRLKAQLDVITSAVKEGTLKAEEGLARVDKVFADFGKTKQASRDQTEIVSGIKDEAKKGNLPQLVTYLKTELGYTDAALAPLFVEAGVKMPASAAAAAPSATQSQPTRGLTSGAQPVPYVPPAGSRAAKALEAREQVVATQAESARLASQAQRILATEFASDAKALTPVELSRKYSSVRTQLPRDQAIELQAIERNIR